MVLLGISTERRPSLSSTESEIYLCRHAETEWSLSGQHTGKSDLPLTKRGEWQAASLRKRLEGVHFQKIFTSPAKRAVQTCEGLGAIPEPLAVEWDYGEYEGLTSGQIGEKRPRWNLFTDGAPGGETPEQVGRRADLVLKNLLNSKGRVALFSHGHFLRVLAARFLGLRVQEGALFSLSVASLSILRVEKSHPALFLWNSN